MSCFCVYAFVCACVRPLVKFLFTAVFTVALFSTEINFVLCFFLHNAASEAQFFCVSINKLIFALYVSRNVSGTQMFYVVSVPEIENLLPVIVKLSQCEFLTHAGVAAAESA